MTYRSRNPLTDLGALVVAFAITCLAVVGVLQLGSLTGGW